MPFSALPVNIVCFVLAPRQQRLPRSPAPPSADAPVTQAFAPGFIGLCRPGLLLEPLLIFFPAPSYI